MRLSIFFVLQIILLDINLLYVTNCFANQQQSEFQLLERLKTLSLTELGQIEIYLDDTFNIFDALVQEKKTSIATGTQQFSDFVPAVTSVITNQDIEAMGARTLEEVLHSVPGLQIANNWFNIPIYSIRGISSGYNPEVLVLVNGVRINDSFAGSKALFWSTYPISSIEHVEVIRGPNSALYGADAFSGVINIITKSAQDINGTEVGMRIGSNNTKDGWLLHGSKWHDINIAAMIDFSKTDGHQRIVKADAQTAFDHVFATNASLAPHKYGSELTTYNIRFDIEKQHWRWRADFFKSDEMGAGVGSAQAIDPTKPINFERFTTDLTYHNPTVTENLELEARLSYWHGDFAAAWQLYPPNAFDGAYPIGFLGRPAGSENQSQFSLSATYHGLQNHQIRFGAGYAYYDLYKVSELRNFGLNPFTNEILSPLELFDGTDTAAAYMPEVARNNYFIFVQDTWKLSSQWALTAGIRYDYYSDFGSTTNPRLGLVWQPRSDLVVKLLYGQAFRAPSFQELYNQNNPVSQGNPNLKPEEIETWELALDYRVTDRMHLSLNLFRYEIEERIAVVPLNNSVFGYNNAEAWKGQGMEFEARWKTSHYSSLLFNYSYQDSENAAGETLPNASKQVAFLRADYLLGTKWYIDTQLNWNDGWARAANDPRPKLDGYTTMDLTLRRKDNRTGHVNMAIGVKNIFDVDVRYPSPAPSVDSSIVNIPYDLPGADRTYFLELRYKF
ncbi:TonB-dependent receptor [Candidatus Albibeggiatoa sp. nov. NOAA]|uniref:TonB-dependent receptor plug domain-containing protein n=1 Tax=Candidatus Albibeggiatoa sp. nov. NOAA TaxID=3162724 RepID=UPI0033049C8D|nr:TonB-dependent receptor [Thiotrichaceae bacterium]